MTKKKILVASHPSIKPAKSLVGAYRAEATDQWTGGITVKIPPLYDVSTSWLKYEELIDYCLNLKELEA